jgi:SOS-response transcriptional repressor LexA
MRACYGGCVRGNRTGAERVLSDQIREEPREHFLDPLGASLAADDEVNGGAGDRGLEELASDAGASPAGLRAEDAKGPRALVVNGGGRSHRHDKETLSLVTRTGQEKTEVTSNEHRARLELGGRIRERRKQLGLSQDALAAKVGVKHAFVSAVERGTSGISTFVLAELAAALETTAEELEGRQPPAAVTKLPERVLSVDETELVQVYRKTKKKDRETIVRFVRSFVDAASKTTVTPIEERRERVKPAPPPRPARATLDLDDEEMATIRIPIRAAAGTPISADRLPDEIDVPKSLLAEGAVVAIRAYGDSMTGAGIDSNTPLLCRPVHTSFRYNRGDVVVASVYPEGALSEAEGEEIVKRFGGTHSGITRFFSENPAHETIRVPRQRMKVEAVVLHRRDAASGKWLPVANESVKGRT